MSLALSLGRRAMGRTWPNPAVGCVIVKDNRVLGRGWTGQGGRPHAEPQALAEAGEAARGGTAYVTLEPCAHHGKTPPCAEALIGAGLARVVTAIEDPDTRVAGKGHALLRAAGIKVETGICEADARRDHAGFLLNRTRARPFVTLKLATSLDGRIATESGESQWITGPEARRLVHAYRVRHDAVMVGSGTALADDPSLTVRGFGDVAQPVRIICDTGLRTSPASILGKTAQAVPVWLCHGRGASVQAQTDWQATCARLVACQTGPDGHLDLSDAMRELAGAGLTRIFCEGGGILGAGLLAAGLVDQIITFNAGLALGAGGTPALGPLPPAPLADHRRFDLSEVRAVGADVMQVWQAL
jgi:diaminohydroxyphosphoribosylaminopyrimidine deaminase/5-amino-6-(5-phosphoribosylamino)uracil reductase